MKILKKIKTDMWINVFMMFFIGVLFIVRPQASLEVTAIIAGIAIFANGIFDILYYLKVWRDFYSSGSLFEGIIKCVLGIFIFTHAGVMTVLFSYVFSVYVIINGIICMETAIYMKKVFEENSGIFIVVSSCIVLMGIVMMFFSPDTVKAVAILTGIIFIISAVTDIVILLRIHKAAREFTPRLQDVAKESGGTVLNEDDVK